MTASTMQWNVCPFSLINFLNLHFIFYVVLAASDADEEEAHPLVIVKPDSDRSRDDAEHESWD